MRQIAVFLLALGLALSASAQQTTRQRLGAAASQLSNTPQQLLQPFPQRRILFCVLVGGAAQEDVIFRGVGGSPVYATVTVNAGQVLGRAMNAAIPAGGLEVVTSNAAGDVTVECTYRLGS